jgi:putative ABC transport system substrate-binding protein
MCSLEPIASSDELTIQKRQSKIQNGYDSTERAGAGGQGNSVMRFSILDFRFWINRSKRTRVLVLSFYAMLGGAAVADAQQPAKVHRLGYLSPLDPARESVRSEPIRLALRELGYIEGQNLVIEYRYTDGKLDRTPALAAELVRLKIDIIVAPGTDKMVLAAKNATNTIPILMLGGTDPVKERLIESLARPGGNITGISLLTRELGGKRLELLKEAAPKVRRVAVLYDPAASGGAVEINDVLPVAARGLAMSVRSWEIQNPDAFEKVFAALNSERPDALYVPIGPLVRINAKRITGFALQNRLPSMYSRPEFPEAGGLMSYDADVADSYRRIAYYIDKILKGAKPGDLPVEQPTKFEFVINLKTAKQIGLTIPPNVLARADRVIK